MATGTYGRGGMLGSNVNPSIFLQDFSGFARAGEMQAQGIANLGQGIAQGIEKYGDIKKEQGEKERQIKRMQTVADAISGLVPDLAPTLEQAKFQLNDLNLPQNERFAIAESIGDILNLGITEVRNRQNIAMKQQEFDARFAPQAPEPPMPRGAPMFVPDPSNPEQDLLVQPFNDGSVRPVDYGIGAAAMGDFGLPQGDPTIAAIERGDFAQEGDLDPMSIEAAATGFGGAPGVLPEIAPRSGAITRPRQGAASKGEWQQGVVQNGVVGQQNSQTKEFKPYPGQTGGMSFRMNPETGEFELLQGAAAGKGSKEEMQQQALDRNALTTSAMVLRDARRAIEGIEKTNPRFRQAATMGGGIGKFLLAGSETADTVNLLETVKSSIAISELVNLRSTGTTLGQVPQTQLRLLSTLLGSLEPGMSNDVLLTTLGDIFDIYGFYLKETVEALPEKDRNQLSPFVREYNKFSETLLGRGISNKPPESVDNEQTPESMDNIRNRFQTLQQQKLQQQQQGR
jgi:hypothetical protein